MHASSAHLCILVIDDDPGDVHLLHRAFDRAGFEGELMVKHDGDEALALLDELQRSGRALPHVVLLDLNMPRVDGREFLTTVKASEGTRHIPVVVVSTSSRQRDIEDSYDLGAAAFLTKPDRSASLEAMARSIVDFWGTSVTFSKTA